MEAVNRGFKTHEQATVELDGGDWEENAEQLAREKEILGAMGGVANAPKATDDPDDTDPDDEGKEGDNK